MAKSNAFENALMRLLYNNDNIANLGDATGVRGSSTAGVIDIALHTADPGEGGSQSTNEVAYTGYSRPSAPRSSSGFTVTDNQAENAAEIDFGTLTAGSGTATWVSFGYNGTIMHRGELANPVAYGLGNPEVKAAAGALTVTED